MPIDQDYLDELHPETLKLLDEPDVKFWTDGLPHDQAVGLLTVLDNGVFACLDDAINFIQAGEAAYSQWRHGVLVVASHIEMRKMHKRLMKLEKEDDEADPESPAA